MTGIYERCWDCGHMVRVNVTGKFRVHKTWNRVTGDLIDCRGSGSPASRRESIDE